MPAKPEKPSPDFPLFAHASGKWAKKIGGRTHYFGRWDAPQAALAAYKRFTDTVSPNDGALTLERAVNAFLATKDAALQRGELASHTFADYRRTGTWLAEYFGRGRHVDSLTPSDFSGYRDKLSERRTTGSLGNEITRVRVLFKWCWDQRLIAAPIHFGPDFRRPSSKAIRRHRREKGKKLFTADQIRRILDESGVQFRAMVLLGINCGFGNTDCAMLPLAAVDLGMAWISYPRQKTEVERELPLWPETVAALKAVLASRPTPAPACADRLFLRHSGEGWEGTDNVIAKRFRATLLSCGMKTGGFYWLRHTFATVGGGTKDNVATSSLMGHVDSTLAATYREEIAEVRLRAVVNHVRVWLFPHCP